MERAAKNSSKMRAPARHARTSTGAPQVRSQIDIDIRMPRDGVRKHGAPDEPSRFPKAAAQPAGSLRVRGVHATRVCQRDVGNAEREYERELPANLASNTPFASLTTRW